VGVGLLLGGFCMSAMEDALLSSRRPSETVVGGLLLLLATLLLTWLIQKHAPRKFYCLPVPMLLPLGYSLVRLGYSLVRPRKETQVRVQGQEKMD